MANPLVCHACYDLHDFHSSSDQSNPFEGVERLNCYAKHLLFLEDCFLLELKIVYVRLEEFLEARALRSLENDLHILIIDLHSVRESALLL